MKKWNFNTIKEKADTCNSRVMFKTKYPYLYKLSTKMKIMEDNFVKEDGTLNKAEIFSAWNYKNLQPLWCVENLSKNNKFEKKEY